MNVNDTIKQAQYQRRQKIADSFSNSKELLADETSFAKAEENPFDKAALESDDDSGIEKSDIMEALDRGDTSIKVTKTGKEIKQQVNEILLPELNAAIAVKKAEADLMLKESGNAPTKEVSTWWTGNIKMDIGYKVYDWDETYIKSTDERVSMSLSPEHYKEVNNANLPATQDEANARRSYNEAVRAICEISVDIKACQILSQIDDAKKFELSPRQVVTFRF